jgi:hypothetical protein
VTVLTRCPACRRADPRDLAALGDAAVAEGTVGALRADVLVLAAGRPAVAVEVKVTHALPPEKEVALAEAGVPAVEVDAREEWERPGRGGVEVVCTRTLGFAPCAACAALARADADRARGGEDAEIAELESYRARGLFGSPAPRSGRVEAAGGRSGALDAAERADLARRFRCPDCGGTTLEVGARLARHPCPGGPIRPVAWRGYGGGIVELSWWRRGRPTSP